MHAVMLKLSLMICHSLYLFQQSPTILSGWPRIVHTYVREAKESQNNNSKWFHTLWAYPRNKTGFSRHNRNTVHKSFPITLVLSVARYQLLWWTSHLLKVWWESLVQWSQCCSPVNVWKQWSLKFVPSRHWIPEDFCSGDSFTEMA